MTASVLAELNAALAASRDRILAREDELAAASNAVLVGAANKAERRFKVKVLNHVAAAANGNGPPPWTAPHADEIVDVPAIVAGLRAESDPIRRAAINSYGAALAGIADKIGIPLDWSLTNPLVAAALAGAAQHVGHIAQTTQLNLMRIVRESYEQGLSIEDTAKAIGMGMRTASPVRARLIARCELAAIANGGSLAAARIYSEATGQTLWKRWAVAPGADFPRHELVADLDGQSRVLSEPFDVDGAALEFPADPSGPPDETANCRCVMLMLGSL
jgi:hypothetical protein